MLGRIVHTRASRGSRTDDVGLRIDLKVQDAFIFVVRADAFLQVV